MFTTDQFHTLSKSIFGLITFNVVGFALTIEEANQIIQIAAQIAIGGVTIYKILSDKKTKSK